MHDDRQHGRRAWGFWTRQLALMLAQADDDVRRAVETHDGEKIAERLNAMTAARHFGAEVLTPEWKLSWRFLDVAAKNCATNFG